MGTLSQDELRKAQVTEERKGTAEEQVLPAATARWRFATRLAFRFCFAYFTLFCINTQMLLDAIPGVHIPEDSTLLPLRAITIWISAHIFHLSADVHPTGWGDTAFTWVQTFCILVIAAVITLVWSLLDRRRANYATLHKWFRVFIRFALAEQMFSYGFGKVFPSQMPPPELIALVKPFGTISLPWLLWLSIGAAPAYEIFAGSAEVLGGLLLILPVSTMFGALVCVADMTQVFMLNMAYDYGVKLYSFHLLLLAILVLAPDLRRLGAFLFTNRQVAPSARPRLFGTARAYRVALVTQLIVGVYLASVNLRIFEHRYEDFEKNAPKPALYGIWDVEEMTIDGQVHPPLLTDTERWRRVIVGSWTPDEFTLQGMDDSFLDFTFSEGPKGLMLKHGAPIQPGGYHGNKYLSGDFIVDRPAPDKLFLDGVMGGRKIHAELKKLDLNQFALVKGGFHWISK